MEDAAIGEVLVPERDLQRRVAELGAEVSRDYEGRTPLLVADSQGVRIRRAAVRGQEASGLTLS